MRRRDVLWLMAAAACSVPVAGFAQPTARSFRIGVLGGAADNPIMGPAYDAFLAELGRLGYREGENLTVLRQGVVDNAAVLAAKAKEFADSKVDVLVSLGTESALKAVVASSKTIPIVFVANNFDPIALDYVKSLAKPGGNVTGIFLRQTELAEKQVDLLIEACPDRKRLAILWDAVSTDQFTSAEVRAKRFGLQVQSLKMEKPPYDLDAAFRSSADGGSQMLLALTSPFFGVQSGRLIELTIRHRLPGMFIFKPWASAGGLMSYGADNVAMYAQSASFVAKILQGAKPVDLPVELPTKFELAVNLKTAKAIGVELPTSILLRANEVIE
jgi:putative tryptophan/tyrosine transport system substrate-binding protein